MSEPFSLAFFGTLLAAGLAGSLHCVGMCGPILIGFTQAVGRTPTARPAGAARGGATARGPAPFHLEFLAYHAGRIWTYAMLGLAAGMLGGRARAGAALYGWQRPVTVILAAAVMAAGVLLLGILPAARLEAFLTGCGIARLRGRPWFASLTASPGPLPRLLLGALMGLLPCGLVYAMLALVASLPPAHAALGMLVFGLGTIPSLTAVLLFGRSISGWMRRHGTRLVAATLIVAGAVMMWRALSSPAEHVGHIGQSAHAVHDESID
jgi:hypothetical protein